MKPFSVVLIFVKKCLFTVLLDTSFYKRLEWNKILLHSIRRKQPCLWLGGAQMYPLALHSVSRLGNVVLPVLCLSVILYSIFM